MEKKKSYKTKNCWVLTVWQAVRSQRTWYAFSGNLIFTMNLWSRYYPISEEEIRLQELKELTVVTQTVSNAGQNQIWACPGPFLLLLAPHPGQVPKLGTPSGVSKGRLPWVSRTNDPSFHVAQSLFDPTVRNLAKERSDTCGCPFLWFCTNGVLFCGQCMEWLPESVSVNQKWNEENTPVGNSRE